MDGDRLREDELIARYFRPLAGEGALGLRDDAALIRPVPGTEIVVTVDGVTAGIDFFDGDSPEAIAARALRVNLSDLAAKGAEPFGYLVALSLPDDWTEDWVAAFTEGLAADQQRYGVALLGGDTGVGPGPLSISITAFGRVPEGTMVRRNGAQPGDRIFVTGTIGDAALGLKLRQRLLTAPDDTDVDHLLHRYGWPEPRTAVAAILRRHATAAMDISDGFAIDLGRLCRASVVSATVTADRVPLSPAAAAILRAHPTVLASILTGGDDYEVLATIPPANAAAFAEECRAAGVPATDVGVVTERGSPVAILSPDGNPLELGQGGWDHTAT